MVKKDLNKMTLKELKTEIESLEKRKDNIQLIKGTPYLIGANYLIRTVTMIYTGKLVKVYDKELVLTNCCWIPETERWADTCAKGIFKEVEPYPIDTKVNINRDSILDNSIVSWKLPTTQK